MALSRAPGSVTSHQSCGRAPAGFAGSTPAWVPRRSHRPVEGGDDRAAVGGLAVLVDLSPHRRRQRLVEADEEGAEAFAGQSPGPLHRYEALAAAGRANDLQPSPGPVLVEHEHLGARGRDEAVAVVLDVPA